MCFKISEAAYVKEPPIPFINFQKKFHSVARCQIHFEYFIFYYDRQILATSYDFWATRRTIIENARVKIAVNFLFAVACRG